MACVTAPPTVISTVVPLRLVGSGALCGVDVAEARPVPKTLRKGRQGPSRSAHFGHTLLHPGRSRRRFCLVGQSRQPAYGLDAQGASVSRSAARRPAVQSAVEARGLRTVDSGQEDKTTNAGRSRRAAAGETHGVRVNHRGEEADSLRQCPSVAPEAGEGGAPVRRIPPRWSMKTLGSDCRVTCACLSYKSGKVVHSPSGLSVRKGHLPVKWRRNAADW